MSLPSTSGFPTSQQPQIHNDPTRRLPKNPPLRCVKWRVPKSAKFLGVIWRSLLKSKSTSKPMKPSIFGWKKSHTPRIGIGWDIGRAPRIFFVEKLTFFQGTEMYIWSSARSRKHFLTKYATLSSLWRHQIEDWFRLLAFLFCFFFRSFKDIAILQCPSWCRFWSNCQAKCLPRWRLQCLDIRVGIR